MIDTGQVYHATLTIRNQSAPPSTATLTITLPDGTAVTPNPGTGAASGTDWLIAYDYTTAQPGLHKAAWLTQGPGTAATDYFNVRAFASIISLAEAKTHLSGGNIAAWTGDDDELRNFLAAVTEVIESKVGPCVRRTVTQRVAEGGCTLALTQYPVISVTSVTSVWTGGPTWTGSSLVTDTDAGTVTTQLGAVPFYYGPWDVVHTVGRAVIPERYQHAAKELLRHLWESQRGQLEAGPLSAGAGETFTASSGWAFSVPNRVLELLADDMTPAI
jgi:hypothetical protein